MKKIPEILVLFSLYIVASFAHASDADATPINMKADSTKASSVEIDTDINNTNKNDRAQSFEEEPSLDAPAPHGLRPGGTLSQHFAAPKIPHEVTALKRPARNYPEQPPTIPHTVRGYQVTKDFNQCLTCHSRTRSPETGAPMVSITHYWDRDNQPLAAVSPRRYFCMQCHVVQHDLPPAKANQFKGIDAVLQQSQSQKAN